MRIGWATVAEAFVALSGSGYDGKPPALALNIHYELDENGNPITDKMQYFDVMTWEDWVDFAEPRAGNLDNVVHTAHRIIRVPTVIYCSKFVKMPMKTLRPTKKAIRERDGNRCAYTNVPLTNKTASIDHILPRSKGGKDTWGNLVACHKEVNTKKGNKLNDEAGLKLLVRPYEPKPLPLCEFIKEIKHPDHKHF